jgi:DNA primase
VLAQGADATFEDKMKALERLKPLCAQLPVGLTRSAFFGALSKHSGLPAAELEAVLRGPAPPVRPAPKPGRSEGDGRPGATPPSPAPAATGGGLSHNGGTTRRALPQAREASERPSGRPAAERAPDALETCFAAAVLRNPRLLDADEHRVHDELQHQGLRAVVHHVATGSGAEDALFETAGILKTSLERASRELPPEQELLERFFRAACRKLKLRRIEEQLAYIAKVTGRLQGASELTDDTRRLIEQRVELLELKKRLM